MRFILIDSPKSPKSANKPGVRKGMYGEHNKTQWIEWDKKNIETTMKRKTERKRKKRKRGLLLLWYYSVLACTTTYTVQSTEQPDTHFRHLRLYPLGDQCFDSTLCRHRWLEVYKSVTCNIVIDINLTDFFLRNFDIKYILFFIIDRLLTYLFLLKLKLFLLKLYFYFSKKRKIFFASDNLVTYKKA